MVGEVELYCQGDLLWSYCHPGVLMKAFLWVSGFLGFLTVGTSLASTGWYVLKGAWTENPKWAKNMDDLIKLLLGLPYISQLESTILKKVQVYCQTVRCTFLIKIV